MLRIDSFPVAVAIPPLQQGIQPVSPVIEAEKIAKPTSIVPTKPFNRPTTGAYHNFNASTAKPQMLTYSRQGMAATLLQPQSGRLFDTYV